MLGQCAALHHLNLSGFNGIGGARRRLAASWRGQSSVLVLYEWDDGEDEEDVEDEDEEEEEGEVEEEYDEDEDVEM